MCNVPVNIKLPIEAREHLEKYWVLARRFYQEGDSPLAAFFAITLIEEVGKVIIMGNRELSGSLDKQGFFSHEKKYAYAVGMTLVVNARVTRLYGTQEKVFAGWFREGDLFRIRNSALYLDLERDTPVAPRKAVRPTDALLLVCIAGEVYAEIQGIYTGTGPDEWARVINEIDDFRTLHAEDFGSA